MVRKDILEVFFRKADVMSKIKFGNWVEKNREHSIKFWQKKADTPFLVDFCSAPLWSQLEPGTIEDEAVDFKRQMEGIEQFLEIIPEPVETFIPMLSPWFQDDAVIPSAFGIDFRYCADGVLRWEKKIKTLEEAVDWPDPDPQRHGWLPKVLKKVEYFSKNAPKEVAIKSAPFRGPLDNAQFILGMEELTVGFYEKPELIHSFLNKLARTQINLLKLEKEIAQANGCLFRRDHELGSFYPEGSDYTIAEDNCISVAPKMYKEFVSPYDEMIFRELGTGGFLHTCGPVGKYVEIFMDTKGCRGVNSSARVETRSGINNIPRILEKLSSRGGFYYTFASMENKNDVETLSYLRDEAKKYEVKFAYLPWTSSPNEIRDVYNYWLSVR